ncbi:hypothetical protein WJX81_000573 [Elliptochloris bilobata]|uniref:N-acetyltransferase domain-containing protein n=1 Tax=Elliptochloris bilobata TaxID=381761 RepID=A0AAW1R2J1_9CHLO
MSAGPPGLPLTYVPIGEQHLSKLKLLNSVIFPINYQDKLYRQCILFEHTQGALCEGELVGAIACRLEQKEGCARLYIVTLGVLAAFRGQGIGTHLLSCALRLAREDPAVATAHLHVQTSNAAAIAFYERHGFHRGAVLLKYYRKLEPPDAVELSKALHAGDGQELAQRHLECCSAATGV